MFNFTWFTDQWLKLLSFRIQKIFFFLLKFTGEFCTYTILKCLHRANTEVKLSLKDPGRKKKKKRSSESRIKATLDVVILELFLSWILFINANVFFFIMENLFLWSCILYVHHISPIPFFPCPPPLCFALLPLTSTVV